MLEALVTNLGRYNEGHFDGEYLKLPTTTVEVQALLSQIHVDGVRYESIFITEYNTDIPGLCKCLGEHESIDELNYLAALLNGMEEWEVEKFAAALKLGNHTDSVKDLINLTQNLDCYEFFPGVTNDEELGYYLIDELEWEKMPEWLVDYFDYEAYGRDFSLNENGDFYESGYVSRNDVDFTEHYNGRDIPEEYRIFSYPVLEKASIRETLKTYQKMIDEAPSPERPRPAVHDR